MVQCIFYYCKILRIDPWTSMARPVSNLLASNLNGPLHIAAFTYMPVQYASHDGAVHVCYGMVMMIMMIGL